MRAAGPLGAAASAQAGNATAADAMITELEEALLALTVAAAAPSMAAAEQAADPAPASAAVQHKVPVSLVLLTCSPLNFADCVIGFPSRCNALRVSPVQAQSAQPASAIALMRSIHNLIQATTSGLSKGGLAGIIIGTTVGAALLLAIVAITVPALLRRRRVAYEPYTDSSVST